MAQVFKSNFVSKTFSELFTTTRASKAWDIVDDALIEYANNEPVLNSNGLSVYGTSTNLLTNNDGNLSTYPVIAGLVSDGTPFITGFNNAISFAGTPAGVKSAYKGVATSSATDYTFSCYVKMDDGGVPITGTGSADSSIDLVVVMYSAAFTSTVEHVHGDVYRVVSTANSAALTGTAFGILKYGANSNRGFTVLGYQLEQADFVSTPIITDASTYTRAADVIVNNAAISSWYNAAEGAMVIDADSNTTAAYGVAATLSGGGSDYTYLSLNDAATTLQGIVFAGGAISYQYMQALSESGTAKSAVAYKSNDFGGAVDGVSQPLDVTGSTPASINKLTLGAFYNGTAPINGTIRSFNYYSRRLAQVTMEAITV